MANHDPRTVSLATRDGRTRIEFQWRDDRYVHRIMTDQIEIARSVEGDASEIWPPSPPLQQLSLESIDNSPTILGVGSAGRSHWSLSVERTSSDQHGECFRFDLALRSRATPKYIGSTYLTSPSIQFQAGEGTEIKQVEIEQVEINRGNTGSCQDRSITIHPDHDLENTADVPTTYRWSYLVIVAG